MTNEEIEIFRSAILNGGIGWREMGDIVIEGESACNAHVISVFPAAIILPPDDEDDHKFLLTYRTETKAVSFTAEDVSHEGSGEDEKYTVRLATYDDSTYVSLNYYPALNENHLMWGKGSAGIPSGKRYLKLAGPVTEHKIVPEMIDKGR